MIARGKSITELVSILKHIGFNENDDIILFLSGTGEATSIKTSALVSATGTVEKSFPFPGWTLSGVLTAGAIQILRKSQWMIPQGRVLFSGMGPLQILVAAELALCGVEISAILQMNPFDLKVLQRIPGLWRQRERLRELWEAWRILRKL